MFDDDELPPMMEGMLSGTGTSDVSDPSFCMKTRVRVHEEDNITLVELNGQAFAFTPRALGNLLTGLTEAAVETGAEVDGQDVSKLREEMPVDLAEQLQLREFQNQLDSNDDDDDDDDDEFTSVEL